MVQTCSAPYFLDVLNEEVVLENTILGTIIGLSQALRTVWKSMGEAEETEGGHMSSSAQFPPAGPHTAENFNWTGSQGDANTWEYTPHHFVVLKAWLPRELMLISLSPIRVQLEPFSHCSVWLMHSSHASHCGALIDDASRRDGEDTCMNGESAAVDYSALTDVPDTLEKQISLVTLS